MTRATDTNSRYQVDEIALAKVKREFPASFEHWAEDAVRSYLAALPRRNQKREKLAKELGLMADVLRTRKGWAKSVGVHGDSISADFEAAARYMERAKQVVEDADG